MSSSLPRGQYDTGGGTREVLIINMPGCSIVQIDIFLSKKKHNNCGTIATNQAVLGGHRRTNDHATYKTSGFKRLSLLISLH